jgi:hypothetical protein
MNARLNKAADRFVELFQELQKLLEEVKLIDSTLYQNWEGAVQFIEKGFQQNLADNSLTNVEELVENLTDVYLIVLEFVEQTKLQEGIHDPMNPGILKKRLGKLSCTKVRAARGKLKDKGTTYAKALQRYLNDHCQ